MLGCGEHSGELNSGEPLTTFNPGKLFLVFLIGVSEGHIEHFLLSVTD
jgi:hypothetical protein